MQISLLAYMNSPPMDTSYRAPTPSEMSDLYLMGADLWMEPDQSVEAYLEECSRSEKYQRGEWRVIFCPELNQIVASLLLHDLGRWDPETTVRGIGSLATAPAYRRQGHATRLLSQALDELSASNARYVFLWSDISPSFYERFGFRDLGTVENSGTLMVKLAETDSMDRSLANRDRWPGYF